MPKKFTTPCLLAAGLLFFYSCTGDNRAKRVSHPDELEGRKAYANSVDGNTYESEWKKYTPEGGVKKTGEPNSLKEIVLLTAQNDVHQRIEMDTLAQYIRESENIVLNQLTGTKDTGEVLVQFALLAKARPSVKMSYRGELDQNLLNRIRLKLEESAGWYRTIQDSCVYQLHFLVNTKNEK